MQGLLEKYSAAIVSLAREVPKSKPAILAERLTLINDSRTEERRRGMTSCIATSI